MLAILMVVVAVKLVIIGNKIRVMVLAVSVSSLA